MVPWTLDCLLAHRSAPQTAATQLRWEQRTVKVLVRCLLVPMTAQGSRAQTAKRLETMTAVRKLAHQKREGQLARPAKHQEYLVSKKADQMMPLRTATPKDIL